MGIVTDVGTPSTPRSVSSTPRSTPERAASTPRLGSRKPSSVLSGSFWRSTGALVEAEEEGEWCATRLSPSARA